jgi:hypothetical protein
MISLKPRQIETDSREIESLLRIVSFTGSVLAESAESLKEFSFRSCINTSRNMR